MLGRDISFGRDIVDMTSEPVSASQLPSAGRESSAIVALTRDLFFGMRVRTIVKQLGHPLVLTRDEVATVEAATHDDAMLALVDFNGQVDWDALQPLIASDVPVVAFGSHTDVEGFRAAKAAGVDRIVSNGQFSRRLPELIKTYGK